MAKNRKAAQDFIIKGLELYPGNNAKVNVDAYKAFFKRISDAEFDKYMEALASGKTTVRYCKRNFQSHAHDKDILAAFAPIYKLLGRPIFQRFEYVDPSTQEKTVSKFPGLLLYGPNRMLNQMVIKKRRYAKDSNSVDELTGQAAGKSRSSTFSAPESIITMGKGHKYLNLDMMKFHGGDERGYQLAKESVYATGSYSINDLLEQNTNVTSVVIYSVLMTAMHYENNFWKEP